MKKLLALICLVSYFAVTASAQNAEVAVGGDVANPFKITAATFAGMKPVSVKAKAKDGLEHEYTGVALYDILTKAGAVPNNQLKGKLLTKYLLVSAADGYQVVVALPEIDPAYTDQVIILANKQDGEDLGANIGPYRLIIPRDKKPARSAMRVISIDVLTAKKL
ncbi:molybdopterin-dependent oxidoreductase [Mucilaginibacter glaciei]|uniref:Molybdopterin-dependent oxidoreductase n=1 Tax=Mucilaginibacter glaciei TaxID=2772109 RepID=A0A926NQM8_9SPHI|nr:molybdopterin-dependent oxidoreductase [Mucilaginibacter glaciei]MBD1394201.1 molybdopterin-dependent oxidoreductase [Mucilaginibacter glaciei]